MAVTLNASNSGTGGLSVTSDATGNLALQTAGTTAFTINYSQAIGLGSTPSYGTNGQVLTSSGSGAVPTWTTVAASQWTTTGSDIYYSTGNVGIGSAPSGWSGFKVLDIGSQSSLWSIGSGNGTSYYSNNLYYNGSARIYKTTGYASEYTQGGGSHQWYIAASGAAAGTVSLGERMRINSGGYFKATNADYPDGADTTYHYFNSNISGGGSADSVLRVRADSTSFAGYGVFQAFSSRTSTNGSFRIAQFDNGNGSGRCFINDNGDVRNTNNSYGSSSDVKLKENIVDTPPKLNDLMKLRVRNYNLKIKPDEKHIGLIAQEAETVFPGLIDESIDYHDITTTDENGKEVTKNVPTGTVTKGIKYSVFVPMLIKAMQEQQELITSQTETITSLTARIVALENKA